MFSYEHLNKFYAILRNLENVLGGKRTLAECNGRMKWPEKGIYFFFDPNEYRSQSTELRVVRVGTHMVSTGAKSIFWRRLYTHRGPTSGYGNHRGSIFRLHVGAAMIQKAKGRIHVPTWGVGQSALKEIRNQELILEKKVSDYIGRLLFLWINIPDSAGAQSDRAYIEKNAIGLLSGSGRYVDIPSKGWLGHYSPRIEIRESGLWNLNHINYIYDRRFLKILNIYVKAMAGEIPVPNYSIASRKDI